MASSATPMREVASAGFIVFRQAPQLQFLLLSHARRFDLPKGHIEPGELPLDAAWRELREETGLLPTQVRLVPGFVYSESYYPKYKRFNGETVHKTVTVFMGLLTQGSPAAALRLGEHQGSAWLDWSPPHSIAKGTIDGLLAAAAKFFDEQGYPSDGAAPPADAAPASAAPAQAAASASRAPRSWAAVVQGSTADSTGEVAADASPVAADASPVAADASPALARAPAQAQRAAVTPGAAKATSGWGRPKARPFADLVVHCRKAPYDVYIGRPNPLIPESMVDAPWGNPFKVAQESEREIRVAMYEKWLLDQPELVARARAELRGKVLGCWCSPQLCHGHVLARVANG